MRKDGKVKNMKTSGKLGRGKQENGENMRRVKWKEENMKTSGRQWKENRKMMKI